MSGTQKIVEDKRMFFHLPQISLLKLYDTKKDLLLLKKALSGINSHIKLLQLHCILAPLMLLESNLT